MLPIDFQETSTLNKLEHDNSEDSSTAMVRVYQPPVVNTTSTRSLTSGSQQPLNGFRVSNNSLIKIMVYSSSRYVAATQENKSHLVKIDLILYYSRGGSDHLILTVKSVILIRNELLG